MRKIIYGVLFMAVTAFTSAYAADQPVYLQNMFQNAPKPSGSGPVPHLIGVQNRALVQVAYSSIKSPIATAGTAGIVKPGNGLTVAPDGTLSAVGGGISSASAITHYWLNSYNASTGTFTRAQPDWSDIANTPTIPAAQVNSDWSAASGLAQILNKPTLPASASCATGYHVSGYNPATGAFTCTADTGAGSSLTYAQFVQMELIARPNQIYWVADSAASTPGSSPDTAAAAEIAQLEAWGVPAAHIKRIAPGPVGAGGTFVVQSLTAPVTMDNVTLTLAGGTLTVAGMTSTASMDSITLVNPAALNLAIAGMASTTTLDGVTLVQAGGTVAVADMSAGSSLDGVLLAQAQAALFVNPGFELAGSWANSVNIGAGSAEGFPGVAVSEKVPVGSTGLDGSYAMHLKAVGGDNFDSGGGVGGSTYSMAWLSQNIPITAISAMTGPMTFKILPISGVGTTLSVAAIQIIITNGSGTNVTVTASGKDKVRIFGAPTGYGLGSQSLQASGVFVNGVITTASVDLKSLVTNNGAVGGVNVSVSFTAYDNSDTQGAAGVEFYIDSVTP